MQLKTSTLLNIKYSTQYFSHLAMLTQCQGLHGLLGWKEGRIALVLKVL